MTKKILTVLLVFLALLSFSSCKEITDRLPDDLIDNLPDIPTDILPDFDSDDGADQYSKGLRFESNGDGSCYVKDIGIFTGTSLMVPPTSPDGDRVVAIGRYAFSSNNDITELVLPETVIEIGDGAFENCFNLEKVSLLGRVERIGKRAFRQCRFTEIDLGEGPMHIGDYAFASCEKLTAINLSPNTVYIGEFAFDGWTGTITSIHVPASVEYIGERGLGNRFNMTKISFAEGDRPLVLGAGAFDGCRFDSVTLPARTKEIGDRAFASCKRLKSINFPDGVERVGAYAFEYCDLLRSAILPDSITELGEGAFLGCEKMSEVRLPSLITTLPSYVLERCRAITEIDLPDGLVSIGDRALCCVKISSIHIPDGVTHIGEEAFYGCSSLSEIYLPISLAAVERDNFIADGESEVKIYYAGGEADFALININSSNDLLLPEKITFNYRSED